MYTSRQIASEVNHVYMLIKSVLVVSTTLRSLLTGNTSCLSRAALLAKLCKKLGISRSVCWFVVCAHVCVLDA